MVVYTMISYDPIKASSWSIAFESYELTHEFNLLFKIINIINSWGELPHELKILELN